MQKLEGRVNGVETSKWAIGKGYWWNVKHSNLYRYQSVFIVRLGPYH